MATLLDAPSGDARTLLRVLVDAWGRYDVWPHRQYVAHEMGTAGLDLVQVLRELPEWNHGYQAVRVLHRAVTTPQDAPAELGDQIAPTVYGLVHCERGTADRMVKQFLAAVAVGCAEQMSFLPDPLKVKGVSIDADSLLAGIRQQVGMFQEMSGRQVRLMLAGEPATWLGTAPDPDVTDWMWKLWFGSLRPFAVDTGPEYLAALEQLIGGPPQPAVAEGPVDPSALPRALDHLDTVWQVVAGQALFKRPGFDRAASLAEEAASAVEFEARCNAISDVLSMLTVPKVNKVQGTLNLLAEDLKQRIADPDSRERVMDAIGTLQLLVKLRRGQTHSEARKESLQAAARLGVRLTGDWAGAWDQVRRVAIEAIYALIAELDAVRR